MKNFWAMKTFALMYQAYLSLQDSVLEDRQEAGRLTCQ